MTIQASDLVQPLHALAPQPFAQRHLGPRESETEAMLATLGLSSLDELIEKTVPDAIRLNRSLALPPALSETQALTRLADMARKNQPVRSLIGLGYYGTITPTVIMRNVMENPGWYTAYTPYQAEVSQGRLEALLTFQQMVVDLTGLDIANASLLDEATAAAAAMTMARKVAKAKGDIFFVDRHSHPQTIAVLKTRARGQGISLVIGDPAEDIEGGKFFGALFSYPASSGRVTDHRDSIKKLKDQGAITVVASDLLALTLLAPPGEIGADIAVGNSQRFGVPMGYGGPHAAFFATRDAYKRAMPGRLIGVSQDRHGAPALRMALQTREQHIRRDKATSNICTAQVLLAVMAAMYAVYHGPLGLKSQALRVHRLTSIVARGLERQGLELINETAFDTLSVRVPDGAETVVGHALHDHGLNLRKVDDQTVAFSLDELSDEAEALRILAAFGVGDVTIEELAADAPARLPEALLRTSAYLEHPVFAKQRSETQMLRYLKRLQDKDLALDRAMIPLGSCTMKLNATTEMIPVTWPGFANLHPFAPADQAAGYRDLFADLEAWLAEITGFDAVSLQPNAGSQGEFTGLLAIRAYHTGRGEEHRNVCLIPSSAHGTNPASAIMAGMKVVVVDCDDQGNVDLEDLRAKIERYRDSLAALMVTYPSTHGVFETDIKKICDAVHEAGGQVYLDGANLNAMVGISRPGDIGADVSHINLHKTFCIPHGGGGPGMGPIGVKAHLAPYLPGHPLMSVGGDEALGAVSAAPWGSPSILPISWAYVALMGPDGLALASQYAVLAANYVARRLEGHFTVLYTGQNGMVAHECIIDIRPIKAATGITVEDVAKRLIDYGFHSPTMSWPVAETLMIEPTESEPKAELDRFCDALIQIRREIDDVAEGRADPDNNLLKNAPHNDKDLIADAWPFPYSRHDAFPQGELAPLYRAPVSRVDSVFGDRHLVCTCPPVDVYREEAA
ncbi:MAG: aminomethyl-transferring glycine dehydrogenase [Geminicoccaceae bacterium]